jgi:osmoprotectant transport system substrate-binding protein
MKRTILAVATLSAAAALSLSACSSSSSGGSGTIASKLVFGGPAAFKTRPDGIDGLKKVYGITFKSVESLDVGGPVTVSALKTGRVDAADLFTTDPAIEANKFVILKDNKNNFAAQNVIPIITKAKNTDGVTKILNGVSAALTTTELQALNTSVEVNKADPTATAIAWLKAKSLDTTGTDASGVTLTVGSADFPENVVIASIYAEALKAEGATITEKFNIGERAKYFPALESGDINLIPEYDGSILPYLDKTSTAVSTADVDKALAAKLPATLQALNSAPGQDSDAVVVTAATAAKYKLTTIEDLAGKP